MRYKEWDGCNVMHRMNEFGRMRDIELVAKKEMHIIV